MSGKTKDIFLHPHELGPALQQDTLVKSDTISPILIQKQDSTKTDTSGQFIKKYSASEADSILIQNELRLKQIESARRAREQIQQEEARKELELTRQKADFESNNIIFLYDSLYNWPNPFFLDNIQIEPVETVTQETDFFIYENQESINDTAEVILVEPKKSLSNQPKSGSYENINHAWYLIIFLLALAQLARVRLYYGKFFTPVFYSLVSYKTENNLYRNKNTPFIRYSFGMNTIFFLIAPLFFYQVSIFFGFNILPYSPIINYLILVGVFIGWYLIKFITLRLIGYISHSEKLFNEYFFGFSISVKNITLFLIPVSVFEAYIDVGVNHLFIYLGISLVALVYVLRVFRLFYLFIIKRFSVLYGILYLCALEILPILILIRILYL